MVECLNDVGRSEFDERLVDKLFWTEDRSDQFNPFAMRNLDRNGGWQVLADSKQLFYSHVSGFSKEGLKSDQS